MPWQQPISYRAITNARYVIRGVWAFSAFVLALFVAYVFAKFSWHLARFFDRTIFNGPW